MHAPPAPITRGTAVVLAVAAAALVAAALVPAPGVLSAAAVGIVTCAIALTLSVRDAAIATVITGALLVIAVGAGTSVALAVVFSCAIAVGVAAAVRIGRGTLALVIAAEVSLYLSGSVQPGVTALGTGGVALAAGLVMCATAIFFVKWSAPAAARVPRLAVLVYLAILVPISAVAMWVDLTALSSTRGWGLATFLVALGIGLRHGRSLALLLAVIAGAFVAGIVTTVAEGVPVLVAIAAVLGAAFVVVTARPIATSTALTAVVLLVGASSAASMNSNGPESLLAAVGGAFLAWGALIAALRLQRVSLSA